MLGVQAFVLHDERAARIDEALPEPSRRRDLEHACRPPIAPNIGEIENQMNVAAGETVDRLPVVAHAEQREIALLTQCADQLVTWPRHVLVFVDEHVFVRAAVCAAPYAANGVGDHAGKIDALGRAEIADIRVVQRPDELQHLTITADMFAAAPLIELAHAVDADIVLPHVLDDGLRVLDKALPVLVESVIIRRQLEILTFRGGAILAEQLLRHELECEQTVGDVLCEQPVKRVSYHGVRRMAVDDGTVGDGGRTADFQAETVERACADRFAGACHDALRHVARGRLGERQYENLFGGGAFCGKQPCDISDDGSGFAGSRARKHEGVVTCAGDRADLLVAQFVLFDIADDVTRFVDAVGWQQRLRGELCRPLRLVLLRLTALRLTALRLTLRRGMRLQLRLRDSSRNLSRLLGLSGPRRLGVVGILGRGLRLPGLLRLIFRAQHVLQHPQQSHDAPSMRFQIAARGNYNVGGARHAHVIDRIATLRTGT